ncbi:MAG: hypothetical protein C0615_00345 [Desulfuromonas sp.]|nr:MAG: hypothetical protein C0615_00345 [Desulfuromonas sp.]
MENRFIMTAFGKDRPGIVADVTRILFENGCNLEDNTMTLLADEFTLVLLFSSQQQDVEEELLKECRRLEREKGISAFIRPLDKRRDVSAGGSLNYTLHVEGMDQAGIVYKVSQFLSDNGVNILDLNSKVMAAPGSGTPLYIMDIDIRMPTGLSADKLDEGLSSVADELNVDITIAR